MLLYNSWYLISLNNKSYKVRLLILSLSAMFSQCWTDRIDIGENNFFLSIDVLSPKKQYTKFSLEIISPNILVTFSNIIVIIQRQKKRKVVVSDRQCQMDKKVIILVTLCRLNLQHTVNNYNEQESIQQITNVSTINHRVLRVKLKIVHRTQFFQNFEAFAITDSDELLFSNLYFLN